MPRTFTADEITRPFPSANADESPTWAIIHRLLPTWARTTGLIPFYASWTDAFTEVIKSTPYDCGRKAISTYVFVWFRENGCRVPGASLTGHTGEHTYTHGTPTHTFSFLFFPIRNGFTIAAYKSQSGSNRRGLYIVLLKIESSTLLPHSNHSPPPANDP